jgi:predicted dehydrogenase
MQGALVCTPHATHYAIGVELIREAKRRYEENENEYKPLNVLMEKPMTTDVYEAIELHNLLMERKREGDKKHSNCNAIESDDNTANNQRIGGGIGCFLVNHSANFRPQARAAHELIQSGKLGDIRHITAFFASPLSWIFDDPSNTGWNEPIGSMLGNGFAWGQQSHILSWIYHVAGGENLIPEKVFCAMTKSSKTGADVSHAASVICCNGVTFSLSGTSLLPGNAHSNPPVGKRIEIKIFGTQGALIFRGEDRDPSSGKLEWLRGDDEHMVGTVEVQCPDLGFQFEDLDQDGNGPASLQCFIDSCLGLDYYVGADSLTGLRSVQTIEAMYRSHVSGNCESVIVSTERN